MIYYDNARGFRIRETTQQEIEERRQRWNSIIGWLVVIVISTALFVTFFLVGTVAGAAG